MPQLQLVYSRDTDQTQKLSEVRSRMLRAPFRRCSDCWTEKMARLSAERPHAAAILQQTIDGLLDEE